MNSDIEIQTLNNRIDTFFKENYNFLKVSTEKNIANGQMSDYSGDLLSTCIEAFLKKSYESKLQMLNDNKVNHFILKCCSFQLKSGNSPFFVTHRRYYTVNDYLADWKKNEENVGDTVYNEEIYSCIAEEESKLNWYQKMLLDLKFYQNLSYREIREQYGLPSSSLAKEIKEILQHLNSKCKSCL